MPSIRPGKSSFCCSLLGSKTVSGVADEDSTRLERRRLWDFNFPRPSSSAFTVTKRDVLVGTVGSGLLRARRNPRARFAGGFSFDRFTRLDMT